MSNAVTYPDRHSVSVRTGYAPEGSTITNYDGTMVPQEVITLLDEEQVSLMGPDYSFQDILAYARGLVEAMSWESAAPAGMTQVFSVTASHKSGWSFVATTWNELPLTLDSLTWNN